MRSWRAGFALLMVIVLWTPWAGAQQNQAPSITINDPAGASPSVRVEVPVGGTTAGSHEDPPPGPCGELQRESCDRAGRSFLIAAAAYGVLCVILALLLNRFFYKRNSFGQAGNILVPVALSATLATVLMGLDPARDPNFVACVACNEYRSAILLSGLAQWPRSVVLGALPVATLSFLVIVGVLNRRSS